MSKKQDITEELIKIQELEKKLEEEKANTLDWKNKWMRAIADYQNLEKRVIQEYSKRKQQAAEHIIRDFLGVLDLFEKAQRHLKDTGLQLSLDEFYAILSRHGVKRIDVLHKQFDPHQMECIEAVRGAIDNEVVGEIRSGYTLGNIVIRVAQVKVGKSSCEKTNEKIEKEATI